MRKVAVCLFLVTSILLVSCISTKTVEGPTGTIEYKGEVELPPEEESAVEGVFDLTEEVLDVDFVESVESVESAEPIESLTDTPAFVEMTTEEKEELMEEFPNAEEVSYIYKPSESDSAKIGNVEIPKWFAYLCFGIIIAMFISMCYIANQNKKKMYYGRRD